MPLPPVQFEALQELQSALQTAKENNRGQWVRTRDLASEGRTAVLNVLVEKGLVEKKHAFDIFGLSASPRDYVWRLTEAGRTALDA